MDIVIILPQCAFTLRLFYTRCLPLMSIFNIHMLPNDVVKRRFSFLQRLYNFLLNNKEKKKKF